MTDAAPRAAPLFDTIVIVDWSAAARPDPVKPKKDAVWVGVSRATGDDAPLYCRTRHDALAALRRLIETERGAGRRLLLGFDFPFGYPKGFAKALTGQAEALAVWAHLADAIEDAPDNANNRFEVAAAINARFPGIGPFWARPASKRLPDLPERGNDRAEHGMAEWRLAEQQLSNAHSCWKLFTTGSVGSQALTGIAALAGLRAPTGAAVWPFDTGLAVPDAPVVLAEIFPSLIDATVRAAQKPDEVRDAAQVRVLAGALAALDRAGCLPPLFTVPSLTDLDARAAVASEEGWILGLGHAKALEAAWAR